MNAFENRTALPPKPVAMRLTPACFPVLQTGIADIVAANLGRGNSEMDLNLRGRRALITGSSKGIGLAIARSLAAEGVHVHLVARTQSELDKVTAEIKKDYSVEAVGHSADLSSSAAIKPLVAA